MRKTPKSSILAAIVVVGIVLSGCAGKPEIVVDPTLNEENAGEVVVYHPSSYWSGLAIDLRVTVDDQYIGSLKRGQSVRSFAMPGARAVKVQPHFLGVPDGKPATLTVEVEAGMRYYLRLTPYVDDVIVIPGFATVLGHMELHPVPYDSWEQRL